MHNNIITAHFDVSPRIIKILGEELIHDKKIAIAELVKNAYDADAEKVIITVSDNAIIIEDDGCGMNTSIIENYWLKPGSSEKRVSRAVTPKFKRLPLGEKGVGRLGVHRLGEKIKVISKMENFQEVVFEIDWNAIENKNSLKDIKSISITENEQASEFKGRTGTKLIIENLREHFAGKDLSILREDLLKILSPFQANHQFRVELHTKLGLFSEVEELNLNDVLKQALFSFEVCFQKNKLQKYTYKCISPNKKRHNSRTLTESDGEIKRIMDKLIDLEGKRGNDMNYSVVNSNETIDLGEVIFKGYIFEPKYSKLLGSPLDTSVTKYLKENGGIRVYRDGIRVYNYGEGGKDNDILDLDRKRAKKLGDNIGYNQILAAIELNHSTSNELIEKTNREGFIHNAAFSYLQNRLDFYMDLVTNCRKIDKAELSLLEGKEFNKDNIEEKVKKIINKVDELTIGEKEKQQLKNNLFEFVEDFKQIKDVFLTAANTGLNLTFVVHELDKIIKHLESTIKEGSIKEIERVFLYLKDSVDAYKDTIKIQKSSTNAVSRIIKQSLFNAEYRFSSHQIEILHDVKNIDFNISGKKGLIIGAINNLFDNAIYWLGYYKSRHKKIYIKTFFEGDSPIILIADNGKGFNISFEAALSPFITGRVDESSMGIGLHLAKQIMEAHQGSILHGNWQLDKLPEEFSEGAIIKLKFPKEVG